jgi:hypothetical protein
MEFRHDLNLALLDDWLVFRVDAETLSRGVGGTVLLHLVL